MLPAIGAALDELEANESVKKKQGEKCRLKVSDLEKIIEAELSR